MRQQVAESHVEDAQRTGRYLRVLPASIRGRRRRARLGEILVSTGELTEARLQVALEHQQQFGGQLGAILVSTRAVSEDTMAKVLGAQLRVGVIDLKITPPSREALGLLDDRFMRKNHLVPVQSDGRFVDVAICELTPLSAIDEVRIMTKLNVRHFFARRSEITRFINVRARERRGISVVTPLTVVGTPLPAENRGEGPANSSSLGEEGLVEKLQAQRKRDQLIIGKLAQLCLRAGYTKEQLKAFLA